MKPWSEACERNREPILAVLRRVFADRRSVLEIGSGTGQHAVHFAAALPHLIWHTSDLPQSHAGICRWLDEARLPNVRAPLALDAGTSHWPAVECDAIFSANTLHIMSWPEVEGMFEGIRRMPGAEVLCIYGPFSYGRRHTSESNARFDASLKARDPASGIRDFEDIDGLARAVGFSLLEDVQMPANNRTLVWRRGAFHG